MTIEDLINEGEEIYRNRRVSSYGSYMDNEKYNPWKRKALLFMQRNYPNDQQTETFSTYVSRANDSFNCQSLLSIGHIRNPRGVEKDLEKLGMDIKNITVKVFIRPTN